MKTLFTIGLVLLLGSSSALGAPAKDDPRLKEAKAQLDLGKLDQAISLLEGAADSGEVHPDAAFSRGVAYLRRALSERARPGDHGQATAGFRETLLLRPGDKEAELALEQTRLAVAKKSASRGEQVQDTLGLGERALLWLSPWVLFWLSVAASTLTVIGLVLMRRQTTKTAGSLLAGICGVALCISAPLAWFAEVTAESLDLGIVIAERAPLLDEAGRAKKGLAPLHEATEVRVLESRGPLLRLSFGEGTSFVRADQVRRLRLPR